MCNKSVSFLDDSKREKKPFIKILKKYIPLAKLVFYVAYLTAHFVIEVVKEVNIPTCPPMFPPRISVNSFSGRKNNPVKCA